MQGDVHRVVFQSMRGSMTKIKMLVGRNILKAAHSQNTEFGVILPYKIEPERSVRLNSYSGDNKDPCA